MKSDITEVQSVIGQGNVIVEKIGWEKCSITLLIRKADNSKVCEIQFFEVVNAEIRSGPYEPFFLVGLQVEDISNYQMEGKSIRVSSEDDQGYLFFYCNTLKIVGGGLDTTEQ